MQNDNAVSKAIRFFRRNSTARVLLIILILFAATYGSVEIMRLVLRTESPLMVVSSESMVPTLNVGDIILVRGFDPNAVTVGTIIIFHSPNDWDMPIVHRVIAVDNQGGSIFFRTQGDHNGAPDVWMVPSDNLIGVYVAKIPYVGILSLQLRGPVGITLIILLVALIVTIEYNESRSSSAKKPSTALLLFNRL